MPSKVPPRVRLEHVFVRDHQRRLQLVMDVLEQEFRQQHPLGTRAKMITIIDDKPLLPPAPHYPSEVMPYENRSHLCPSL